MSHLFLSDVHIGAFEEDVDRIIRRDLISLIEYCALQNIQIHILGDLFDYWMEYPEWHPSLGSNVPYEFFEITLDGKRVFLHHGDGLKDPAYHLPRPPFHRLLRNKMFVKLYQSLLTPKNGLRVMKAFSDYSKRRSYCDPSILNKWSENFLNTTNYDVVISGHDHHPRILNFENGTYINLGTFFDHRTISLYNNGSLELVVWDAASNTLLPFEHRFKIAANL